MNTDPHSDGSSATPVIVEDLFLTDSFLIKGRLVNKYHRLTKMLEDTAHTFVEVADATMVSLRGDEVVRTPSVLVNLREIILAHELVDVAGDPAQALLAANAKTVRIRAFYGGAMQFELAGMVEAGGYEPSRRPSREFFVMQEPVLRGLDLDGRGELSVLASLGYAIVQKRRMAYIYDLS